MSGFGHSPPTGHFGLPETATQREHRHTRWRRAVTLAATFVIVVALATTVTAGTLLWYGERSVSRVDVPGLSASQGEALEMDEISEVLNVLLVGDDSRDGLSEEQLIALGTEEVDGGRTDTIMLLQLDPNRETAALLSFPRDLLVTRCDGSRGRINGAYNVGEETGVGGAACLVETVSDLTRIPINHYVEVNFAGFIDVVDVLGGVKMHIEEPGLRDRHAGLDLPPGCQRLDGAQALGFVRARTIDSDFGRIARQQRFVRELMSEVTSAGTLLNVPRMFSLVDAAGRAVETDRKLSLRNMRRIAFTLRNLTSDHLDMRVVPAVPRIIDGAEMVVVKEREAAELFGAFRRGTLARDDLGREEPQDVAVDDVPPLTDVAVDDVPPLTVLNGTGISGMAASAAQYLEGRGFAVAETGNADTFGFMRVRVVHPPERREEAQLVAAAFDDAMLQTGQPHEGFAVIVGTDFDPAAVDGASPVEEGQTHTAAAPEPEPSPAFRGAEPAEHRC